MTLIGLAAKNLARHKARTVLTVVGVGIAAACLVSILAFDRGYRQALQEELGRSGVHLFVSTEGCPLEAASLILHGGEIPKFLNMERLTQVKAVQGVKEAGGFLIFSVLTPDGSRVDLFYGVTDEVRTLKPNWKVQGSWFKDEHSIILGAEAARVEKRSVGDKLYLASLDREFEVVGILNRTGSQDDSFFFLPLVTAQTLFRKPGKLTAIGVQVSDLSRLQQVKDRLETLPDVYVVTSEQMGQEIMGFVGGTKALMTAVLLVALIVSAVGVLNTVLMAAVERQAEFGYLRCVGAGRADVARLVLLETLTVCTTGGLIGLLIGVAFASRTEQWMRPLLVYAPGGPLLRPDAGVLGIALVAMVGLGLLAGLYPAWRASRVSPMEAVRNE